MRIQRLEALEAYIKKEGSVSISQLCEEFQVSVNTVRRDIDALVQNGKIKKVYGGVVALGQTEDISTPTTPGTDGFYCPQSGISNRKAADRPLRCRVCESWRYHFSGFGQYGAANGSVFGRKKEFNGDHLQHSCDCRVNKISADSHHCSAGYGVKPHSFFGGA